MVIIRQIVSLFWASLTVVWDVSVWNVFCATWWSTKFDTIQNMTSVQVATKAMAAGEGWDSDGSLSWEDFFGKKMIEHHT